MLGHAKQDGPTYCFSDLDSTGIPQIQEWCREIGNTHRRTSWPAVMEQLLALKDAIYYYVRHVDMDEVVQDDANAMRDTWQSGLSPDVGFANRLQQVCRVYGKQYPVSNHVAQALRPIGTALNQRLRTDLAGALKQPCEAAVPLVRTTMASRNDAQRPNFVFTLRRQLMPPSSSRIGLQRRRSGLRIRPVSAIAIPSPPFTYGWS